MISKPMNIPDIYQPVVTMSKLELIKLIRQPSPLSLFLTIYSKANHECYINHMEGARALKEWLGQIDLPIERYPEILNTNFYVPRLLAGYESQQIAIVLSGGRTYGKSYRQIHNAIYFVMSREIISELY